MFVGSGLKKAVYSVKPGKNGIVKVFPILVALTGFSLAVGNIQDSICLSKCLSLDQCRYADPFTTMIYKVKSSVRATMEVSIR